MKEVYPEFSDQVNFYAVGTFTKAVEDLNKLENYREQRGHPWFVANPVNERDALASLNVSSQSTKIAFDSRGVITYRDGFGGGDAKVWRQVFSDLIQSQ
jgi:hypothetical protein